MLVLYGNQAIAFDGTGAVVDAAFYNQLQACDGSIVHTGDNRDGAGEGIDEAVTVFMDRVPPHIQVIALVVSAYQGGTFINVETATAHVQEVHAGGVNPMFDVAVGCHGNHTSLLLCLMHRDEATGQWLVSEVNRTMMGQHFQDCLPDIRSVVDSFLPDYMVAERVLSMDATFNMKKDDVAGIPSSMDSAFMGLGWETPGSDLDLDASVIMLNQSYGHVDTCYFSNKDVTGVHHRGDNTTGEGKGDDEVIDVHLNWLSPEVHHLVFVVNIYSDGRSFREVFDSYCRLCLSQGESEVARFTLDAQLDSRGLIFASISRSGGGWAMRALGVPCNGKKATESVDQVIQVMQANPPLRVSPIKEETKSVDPVQVNAVNLETTTNTNTNTSSGGGCCTIS